MHKRLARILDDCSGATAIEYGLIAALIMLAIVATVTVVGTQINATFSNIASAIQNSPAQ